jgi:hypothetical protein
LQRTITRTTARQRASITAEAVRAASFYESITPIKKKQEDKPDYLAEIMATLEELERGQSNGRYNRDTA